VPPRDHVWDQQEQEDFLAKYREGIARGHIIPETRTTINTRGNSASGHLFIWLRQGIPRKAGPLIADQLIKDGWFTDDHQFTRRPEGAKRAFHSGPTWALAMDEMAKVYSGGMRPSRTYKADLSDYGLDKEVRIGEHFCTAIRQNGRNSSYGKFSEEELNKIVLYEWDQHVPRGHPQKSRLAQIAAELARSPVLGAGVSSAQQQYPTSVPPQQAASHPGQSSVQNPVAVYAHAQQESTQYPPVVESSYFPSQYAQSQYAQSQYAQSQYAPTYAAASVQSVRQPAGGFPANTPTTSYPNYPQTPQQQTNLSP
jgi:hypothetical protein